MVVVVVQLAVACTVAVTGRLCPVGTVPVIVRIHCPATMLEVAVTVVVEPDAVPWPEAMPLGFVNCAVIDPPGPTPIVALRPVHAFPVAKLM